MIVNTCEQISLCPQGLCIISADCVPRSCIARVGRQDWREKRTNVFTALEK